MSPKVTDYYKDQKRQSILDAAEVVFIRKGFFDTTMKDVVEACNISRGGLYKYFSSTEEIFREILERDRVKDEKLIEGFMETGRSVYEVLKEFLESEYENILNIKNTLIPASYEFFIRNAREGKELHYLSKRYDTAVRILNQFLEYGKEKAEISKSIDVSAISSFILASIEGMIITAVTEVTDKDILRKQIDTFYKMLQIYLKQID